MSHLTCLISGQSFFLFFFLIKCMLQQSLKHIWKKKPSSHRASYNQNWNGNMYKLQKCETIYSISNFVLRGDQIWVEFPDHIYGNLSADMLTIPTKPNFIKVITTYSWLLSIPIRSIPFNVAKKWHRQFYLGRYKWWLINNI